MSETFATIQNWDDVFLKRIVTEDKSCVSYYEPEKQRTSKDWRHSNSLKPKEFRTLASAGKVTLTLFWDHQGQLVEHYKPKVTTVTSTRYYNHLRPAIRSKRRGLSTGTLLLHGNAKPHTARVTRQGDSFRVSPSSAVLAWCGRLWLLYLWATQRSPCRKDFLNRWRISRGGAWVATHVAETYIFTSNSGTSEPPEGMHWAQRGICYTKSAGK
jgi:hypothetical protein